MFHAPASSPYLHRTAHTFELLALLSSVGHPHSTAMSQNEQYRINKRKASASPPPESTRSWIDNNLDVNDPEDSGVLIKISLPSIQDKEDFHRTTLVLIEKLSTHMWNDLLCHVPIRQNRRHLSRVLGKFGFVSKHDGALLQYILDVPCAAACVCASAPEEKQPLDRCDNPDRNRRVKERAEQLDKFFLDHDRFCDLGPVSRRSLSS